MNFPESLTVFVRDRESGQPIFSVALILTLFATRKNNYSMIVLTDGAGGAKFTRTDCEFKIHSCQRMFLMDYAGTLEECRPYVEVALHLPERVARMIQQYKSAPEFWGRGFRDPEALMRALEIARNAEYEPNAITLTEAQILENAKAELWLSKK